MAGRREKELVARVPEMAEVARWLRQSRRLSGLTYEQLGELTGCSRGSLNRAANGWRSPWPVVKAFTLACGTSVDEARQLWLRAKAAVEDTDAESGALEVGHVGSFDALREAMISLRALAGWPSLRELARPGEGKLARSTLAGVLKGISQPRRELVLAFVHAMGVKGDQAAAWGAAWDRADQHSRRAHALRDPVKPMQVRMAPGLLAALADVPLPEGNAVAELVDVALRVGGEAARPDLVAVDFHHDPSMPEHDAITVTRHGAGIDREHLSRAFVVGWAGEARDQDLFGPIFLLACLRLGSRITLRTAQAHEMAWTVLTFDLAMLASNDSWQVPVGAEPKTEAGEQGLRVTIEALRRRWPPGRQDWLQRNLGDLYSYLLREQHLRLTVADQPVAPRRPCIWAENRLVERRQSSISAVQKIDIVLATLYRCRDCRQTSPLGSPRCPQCQGTQLERTENRVWGWLGVQRYLHQSDYGIDFYRNGRKVLIRDKRLFSFGEDPDHVVVEYPVDPPAKGRLVGEIHCDHVPANFTSTAFDYDSPEWRAVVHAVRGPGPLSPIHARRLGFAPNTSPLALLFSAFRRNDPGLRCLIPGDGARALHETAAAWAERFHQQDPAFQSDERWFQTAAGHDLPRPASVAVNDCIDLVSLSPGDLSDLVHRLYMNLYHSAEGPRELIGPGGATTVLRDRPGTGERWVLQARSSRHVVPLETVHALAGQMLDVQAARGVLVTTSWFGASSHAFARRTGRIDLVDGRALKALLQERLQIQSRLGLSQLPPEWELGDIA
ncbi:restriction endonuclease [Streptomyces sp. NPDC058107]|uniref:restriction endonuclease n=1 Tax=Streptomyces sp. NPDC058107 TaxID=3346343 RepID=UPI0036EEF6D1